jgi:hypothetical protein
MKILVEALLSLSLVAIVSGGEILQDKSLVVSGSSPETVTPQQITLWPDQAPVSAP